MCAFNLPLFSIVLKRQEFVVETSQVLLLTCETKIGTLCSKVHAVIRNRRTWFASLHLIYFREASSLFSFKLIQDLALIH